MIRQQPIYTIQMHAQIHADNMHAVFKRSIAPRRSHCPCVCLGLSLYLYLCLCLWPFIKSAPKQKVTERLFCAVQRHTSLTFTHTHFLALHLLDTIFRIWPLHFSSFWTAVNYYQSRILISQEAPQLQAKALRILRALFSWRRSGATIIGGCQTKSWAVPCTLHARHMHIIGM